MTIKVVFDCARPHMQARLRQAMARFAGGALLLIGLLASVVAIPTSLVPIGIVLGWFAGEEMTFPADMPLLEILLAWAVCAPLALAGVIFGLRLVRRGRRLVLFLRRFGYDDATRAVTYAVTRTIGASWRLVTLDDAETAPVGVPAGTRRLFGIGRTVFSAVARLGHMRAFAFAVWSLVGILAIDLGLAALKAGSLEAIPWVEVIERYNPVLDAFGQGRLPWDAVGPTLPGAFAAAAIVLALLLIALLVTFVALLLAFPLGGVLAFVAASNAAVRSAEKSHSFQIGNAEQIEAAAAAIGENSRKVLAPRLTVLRVTSGVWPRAVTRLASLSSVVLIDVSEPTENVLWEIDTLAPAFGPRCVLIGHQERVAWLASPAAAAPSDTYGERLSLALSGREVLAYTTDARGLRRFARALRGRLFSIAA
jgi:hypothetical protein